MTHRMFLGLGLAVALSAAPARAADELKVGDTAPEFTMKGSDGKTYKLSDFKGKKAVVVAWYPKAFTGGCTAECKSFAEQGNVLKDFDVVYFTASVDAVDENTRFAKSLNVTDYAILSDPEKTVAKTYGVMSPRGYANRWTFYIDKEGKIAAIEKKIDTKNAAPEVAAKLKSLGIADKK
jgi:peroxiredoxin Q/BCP